MNIIIITIIYSLVFDSYPGELPPTSLYRYLGELYSKIRFEIKVSCWGVYDEYIVEIEDGKITKHIHEYIDDKPHKMVNYKADYLENTLQVISEQYDDEEGENDEIYIKDTADNGSSDSTG